MKIIDKYLLNRFLGFLTATIISCLAIFVFIDMIGNLNRFLNISFKYVMLFYVYLSPYIIITVFPIAMLLASMFTIGILAKNNEITALRTSGVSTIRITSPLLIASTLICMSLLLFSETVLPITQKKKTAIYNNKIKNRPSRGTIIKRNFCYWGLDNTMFYFKSFNKKTNVGKGVLIEKYTDNKISTRIKAEYISWKNKKWEINNASVFNFKDDVITVKKHKKLNGDLIKNKPTDFSTTKKNPEDMNYFELKKYIDNVQRSGGKAYKYLSDLHFKISYPLINLIVVLLGVSLTTSIGKSGLTKIFGVGLLLCFVYYMFAKFGLALGHSGDLNPLLAAWIGNIVFFIVGIFLFIKVSK